MSDFLGVAQALGFVAQTVGLITVAIKTGNWKGITDNRIETLEKDFKAVSVKVESLDSRLDGLENEFSKTLVKLETNIEYIKESLDELKKSKRD